jgi:hypothetical protein
MGMKDDVEVLGPLERTARAFMLDASEAMRGDITRAIVEYVTNADDAYTRKGAKGRIVVEVEHRRSTEPWKVTIRDRATGMSLLEMRERIGRQGGRTADFGRLSVRGNLGLGSKDPACFGRVTFYSIKEHKFSWFSIDDQGQRTAARKELECTDEIRESLGIVRGNGTVVTIEVLHPTSCPRHDNLKNILRNHFLLRSIVEDPDREVLLLHANKQGAKPERLHWQPQKAAVKVNKRNLPVPEYPDARVDVLIAEADESFADEGRRSPTRGSGLLIRGRRAIYDCTLFSFEGNPYAACFCGSLQCDYIDRLAEEFDERVDKRIQHTVDNPIPIISRRREGLAEEHPFVKALKRLAEAELGPLITERERRAKERSRTVQSERTTRLFSQLAREAAKFIQEAADAEELELAFTGSGEKPAPLLAIVPRAIELPVDSEHILTIMAAKGDAYELAVSIEFSPPGLVNSPSTTLKLRPSRRRSDVLTSTIKVSSGPVVGATLLVARLDSITADCAIEVIEATQVPEPLPPASLEFERSRYRLVVNKPKPLLVRAPIDLYAEGASIRVTSNHASVVILDGGKAVLRTRRGSALMEGEIRVEGREVIDRAVLTASDGLGVSAEAVVTVVRREEAGNDFKTELVPEVQGDQRAQWSTDYRTLRIMGEHLAVKPYLGKVEDNYPGQDSHEFRVLLAEILSDAVVRRILLEKYKEDEMDIGTLYVQQYKLMAQLLARAHRIVAAAPER